MSGGNDNPFDRYLALLIKWNARFNLTALTKPDEIRARHFDDSLEPLPFLRDCSTLIDLGSGAGFPGIPLKIANPQLDIVLLDATRKKIAFCSEVIRTLNLVGIRAIQGRAEDPSVQSSVGTFDAVISRATWPLPHFIALSFPYLGENGILIAMRGLHWKQELESSGAIIEQHGLELADTHPYTVGNNETRCLLIFKR